MTERRLSLGFVLLCVAIAVAACGGRAPTLPDSDGMGGSAGRNAGGASNNGSSGKGGTGESGGSGGAGANGAGQSGAGGNGGSGGTCNQGTCGAGGSAGGAGAGGATGGAGGRGGSSGTGTGGSGIRDAATADAVTLDAGVTDAATGETGTTDAGSVDCRPFVSPAICSMNPTGPVSTPTAEAFRRHIVARWVLCGSESVFGNNQGDIGLELLDDGRWFKLYPGPSGSTVRGAGFDQEGTWEIIDVGQIPDQPFQLNLNIFGSGTVITHPVFAATPPAMRLNNFGVFVGDYVLDPTVPVGSTRCGNGGSGGTDAGGTDGGDAGTGDALCPPFASSSVCSTNPTGQVSTPTADAFRKFIIARWVLCGKESPFGNNAGDIGLEVLDDGRWYKLYPAMGGGTARGAGFDQEGTWEIIDVGQIPDQPFQLNLNILGSGTAITHPAFAATPPAMRLDNNGVFVGNYVLDPTVPVGSDRCR